MVESVVDIGGLIEPEDEYEGARLIIFALDPGVTSGWSALGVPVALIPEQGVARTLARCWWRHGEIYRGSGSNGHRESNGYHDLLGSQDYGDSKHVGLVLEVANLIYSEWVNEENEDEFVFVNERFDLRMLSSDPSLLAPVRVNAIMRDRLTVGGASSFMFMQSASDAKNVVTDQRLRMWCMYDRHSGVHARDADRHGILFLRRFSNDSRIRRMLGW